MKATRFRLTTASKVLIMLVIVALIGGGIFAGLKTGFIKADPGKKQEIVKNENPAKSEASEIPSVDESGNVMNTEKTDDRTINLSLDEWIGWKEIIDANGGLTTTPGSIYDKLGIKVNISVINDATQSSNAIISGKLDAAGYTINRTAFLSNKFTSADVDVVMPYITNFSNGGDGIIAKSSINNVEDLIGAKIGVPQFSEAHSLVVWFVNQSDLSDDVKKEIIDGLIFFETPDEAAKAFFAGQIDVAATWEPYLTQAQNMSDCHILFSTKTSSSLIMDGILFNEEFVKNNSDVVTAFIDGALQAAVLYESDLATIKSVMPMFSTASDQDILDNCASAKLTTYADNIKLFNGTAKTIYNDMCSVWESIGEKVNRELVNTIFDDTYISPLSDKYDATEITKTDANVVVTEENMQEVIDTEALIKKSTSINFAANTAKFVDSADASSKLNDFINIANVLDGSIIQIEGNIASDNPSEEGVTLSYNRAETIKNYFILNGISANRIVVVGNGGDKPIAPNDCEENMALNRRTDIFFKIIE